MTTSIFSIVEKFFDQNLETKMQWEMDRWGSLQIGGYKPAGKHTGAVEGKRDGFENFLVPLNTLSGLDRDYQGDWPENISSELPKFTEFEFTCHDITLNILSKLSNALMQSRDKRLEDSHRKGHSSTTTVACLKYLPSPALTESQVGHMAHTDVGSLTLLFTSSPGLQVFQRSSSSWIPATPRPGSVVVNVRDTLSFMSGGRLRSCLHRVIPSTGHSGLSKTRYSLAFFQRPELSARFVDGNGREWTGKEWHQTKYKLFRADNNEQRESSVLTGEKGFLGSWKGVEVA
ncbi:MAG: hypothetical protein Q9214_005103 [Letrouitia sp. 1 TL-2023]